MHSLCSLLQKKGSDVWLRVGGGFAARRMLYGLLALALFTQPALAGARSGFAAEAAPAEAQLAPEAGLPLVNWEYDQIQAAIAYADQSDTFLVVWEDHHWAWGEARDIYAQRVNSDGSLAGSRFAVPSSSSNHCLSPDLAYNSVAGEFLVVWEYEYSADDHDIYARRVGADGSLIGEDIDIAIQARNEANPAVAFSPSANSYMLVYERREGAGDTGPMNIVAQHLDADGTPNGAPVVISASLYDQLAPDVAYNDASGEYLTVWQDGVYVGLSGHGAETPASPLEFDVYASRLDGGGSVIGVPVAISTWQYDQIKPRLAYSDASDQFLVVWEDHHWAWGEARDLYAQRVNADGSLAGGNFAISWEGDELRLNPDVAYNPAAGEFLTVWEYALNESDHDVYRRRISSGGALLEDEQPISRLSSFEGAPVVAADASWSYLVIWEDGRNSALLGLDLYSDLVPLYRFSGYVFEGEVGDEGAPMGDVLMELYCSNDSGSLGDLVASARTNRSGAYGLTVAQVCEYYNIVETTPDGYTAVGGTSISGTVIDNHWIQYTYPLDGVTLGDNKFWNQSDVLLPDLTIMDGWSERGAICYRILNDGEARAAAGHYTALLLDGAQVASDRVDADLDPGADWSGCFDYAWACTPDQDVVDLRADYMDVLAELDETNNQRVETWTCDTTPPEITNGPTVAEITQNSARISWSTDEISQGVVSYGAQAGLFDAQIEVATLSADHSLTLSGLDPARTYHFQVQASDPSGNSAASRDGSFRTLALPDSLPPLVQLLAPQTLSETVMLRAEASDDQGVDKVEFYLDGELLHTDYSPPYLFQLDSNLFDNGDHLLSARALDLAHLDESDQAPASIANPVDASAPKVTITAPQANAQVKGKVQVSADLQDDQGLYGARLYVQGQWEESEPIDNKPKNHTVNFEWDSTGLNGKYTLAVMAFDIQGKSTIATRVVNANNPAPPPPPKLSIASHKVTRSGNTLTVTIAVRNDGGSEARNLYITDYLKGFQPVSEVTILPGIADIHSGYIPSTHLAYAQIRDPFWLYPGYTHTFAFKAVPILHSPAAGNVTPSIGDTVQLSYQDPEGVAKQLSLNVKLLQAEDGASLPQAHAAALKVSDYLLATDPTRLHYYNLSGDSFEDLLSAMAELASLKKGALGYLEQYKNSELRDLIQSTGNWSQRLAPGWASNGYLLIVGETEIVPAFNRTVASSNNTTKGKYVWQTDTDYPYSSTGGDERVPEISLGRAIGNNAQQIEKVLRTSINVTNQETGYGFDRSFNFAVGGYPQTIGGGADDLDFPLEAGKAALAMRDKGIDGVVMFNPDYTIIDPNTNQIDVTATTNLITNTFYAHTADNDVIFLAGHGNWSGVDVINNNNLNQQPDPLGDTNPVVYSSACDAGDYINRTGFSEIWLQKGAGNYLGAMMPGACGPDWCSNSTDVFRKWDAGEPFGLAFKQARQALDMGDILDRVFNGIYNLFGDPKYGAEGPPTSSQTSRASIALPQGSTTIEVSIPDFSVTHGEYGDQVTIPGGFISFTPGRPEVPAYRISVPYPSQTQIQDVILVEKSDLTSGEGLQLGGGQISFNGERQAQASLPSFDIEEWPEVDFEWWVNRGPEQNTLVISIYPLRYYPLTTAYSYHQRYVFAIEVSESAAAITHLALDSPVYGLGDMLQVALELDGGAAPGGDVYLHMTVIDQSTRELVTAFPVRELYQLQGPASYTAELSSAGLAPGNYCLQVQARQASGDLLDEEETCFTLGRMQGEAMLLSVSPRSFIPGEAVALNLNYANSGELALTGQAVLKVRNGEGEELHTWTQEIDGLLPAATGQFSQVWDTDQLPGGGYRVYAYVSYDGQASMPLNQELSAKTRLFLPMVAH